ncbi:MAG: NAD(P)-dependent oxidoreductase [Elusimicrobiales bacterium]
MKKLLLTGGSGFIGRNIIETLGGEYEISAPSHAELELTDSRVVREYFRNRHFDAVIHSAIKPGHRNAKDLTGLLYANTRHFINLAQHDGAWGKMIYLGSGLAYNPAHYRPKMKEDFFGQYPPEDEAGYAKYICSLFTEKSAGRIVELRPFGVYGKYEDYAIRFISNAICKTLFELPITIKQNRRFDYIYVADLIGVIRHFIENPAKHAAYNVTPDESVELLSIAHKASALSGGDLPVIVKTPGMGVEYSGDNSLLKTEFSGFLKTGLDEGIRGLYNWYAARRDTLDKSLLLEDK